MDAQNGDESINISDVIEVIETDQAMDGVSAMQSGFPGSVPESSWSSTAYLQILEEPAPKSLRFRYECEGRSAGSIPGIHSTPDNKTYPAVQIVGYSGPAVITVSCVTKDPPYRPHPHNIVGKENCKYGVLRVVLSGDSPVAQFPNLGIQCVKKKDIEDSLTLREKIKVDPFRTGFAHKTLPSTIDLNSVRLCFQAFIEGPVKNKFTVALKPIVSEPIYDKKAISDLVITKLSQCSASVAGGTEMILLCEKVAKEDIAVRFFEEKEGQVVWEGSGDFTPAQVHRQVAIVFKTPAYRDMQVEQPVQVFIQLRRPSDNMTSDPLPFIIKPLDSELEQVKRKRQKYNSERSEVFRGGASAGPGSDHDPIRMHLDGASSMVIKREPPDQSPGSYTMYGGGIVVTKVSPMCSSRTPSPLDYRDPGLQQVHQVGQGPLYTPLGGLGGPFGPQQPPPPPPPFLGPTLLPPFPPAQPLPGAAGVSAPPLSQDILNLDAYHQYTSSLRQLNSKDLAEVLDASGHNLSADLSNSLNLNDPERRPTSDSLTDSLTSFVNKTYDMTYHNK